MLDSTGMHHHHHHPCRPDPRMRAFRCPKRARRKMQETEDARFKPASTPAGLGFSQDRHRVLPAALRSWELAASASSTHHDSKLIARPSLLSAPVPAPACGILRGARARLGLGRVGRMRPHPLSLARTLLDRDGRAGRRADGQFHKAAASWLHQRTNGDRN